MFQCIIHNNLENVNLEYTLLNKVFKKKKSQPLSKS